MENRQSDSVKIVLLGAPQGKERGLERAPRRVRAHRKKEEKKSTNFQKDVKIRR